MLRLLPGYDPFIDAGACTFDQVEAENVIGFFGEKAGQPFILEPWQEAFLCNLFGWKRPDGSRRYRQGFLGIPRKNGKTAMAGGVANFVLFCDGEIGAEIIIAAAERDQARLLFDVSKNQVLQNPELAAIADARKYAITIESMASSIIAVSSDASTKHGTNPHVAIIDEVHAQKNPELVDTLSSGQGARRQPLIIYISTSDFDTESVCNEKWDYARAVRDRVVVNPYYLPAIYEATAEDDWTDRKVWERVNPNLGVSVSRDFLESEFALAQASPRYENTFKRLYLNIRTGQDQAWLQMERWDACDGEVDEDELEGHECFAGLDLSSTTDLSALALVFPQEHGGPKIILRCWAPTEGVEKRSRTDRVDYRGWAGEGLVTLTSNDTIDYDVIREEIIELAERYEIESIGVDPHNATQLMTQLDGEGFDVQKFVQSFRSMSPGTREFERLVIAGELGHGANPVLRWMAGHVAVEEDAYENIRPSKKRSADRIDGVVAVCMALGLMVAAESEFIYSETGEFAQL